jgi:hypothetical protein
MSWSFYNNDGQILQGVLAESIDTTELATDAVTNVKVATGIDATKLADGTVTNAELQYINTLSSNAQNQLAAKQATIDASARLDAASIGANGDVSNTEYGYLDGVTSAIQTQITAASSAASTTAAGIVELAIAGEVNTGTSAALAVTPDGLAGSVFGQKTVVLKVISETTVLTTDHTGLFTVPLILNGMDLVQAEAAIYGVSSSNLVTVQIHNLTDTADMLGTEITIKVGEFNSYTADARSAVNAAAENVATGDRFRIDVDGAGTGTDGLDIILTFEKVD